jgi:hypothetical protein
VHGFDRSWFEIEKIRTPVAAEIIKAPAATGVATDFRVGFIGSYIFIRLRE